MKRIIIRYLIAFLFGFFCSSKAEADLIFSQTQGGFPIVGTEGNAVFIVSQDDAEVVTTVARCVIQDIKTITGKQLSFTNSKLLNSKFKTPQQVTPPKGELGGGLDVSYPIIAGTIGQSAILDGLIADGKVDLLNSCQR